MLIAKFPDEDHQPFRRILAHALKAYRQFPNDQKLIREMSLAIHDFVDKLRQMHFLEALRWLRRFEQVADKSDDKDVRDAQEDIHFHVLLLGLALRSDNDDLEGAARSVFEGIQVSTGIGSDIYPMLLNRLKEEVVDE